MPDNKEKTSILKFCGEIDVNARISWFDFVPRAESREEAGLLFDGISDISMNT